jgi:hypothetical protein
VVGVGDAACRNAGVLFRLVVVWERAAILECWLLVVGVLECQHDICSHVYNCVGETVLLCCMLMVACTYSLGEVRDRLCRDLSVAIPCMYG